MTDNGMHHHDVDGSVCEQVKRTEPLFTQNLLEKQDENGVVYYVDEKTGERFRKIPAGVDDNGVKQQRLLPINENKLTNWKGKEGFLFAQKLVCYLPPKGRYQLWVVCNEDGKDTIGREMTEDDWLSMRMKATSKLHIRCSVCTVISSTTTLNSLTQGRCTSCFCKGRKMRYRDPQYFQCMMDPVICEATNQFTQMHNKCVLDGWDVEEFIRQVTKTGKETKLPLRCMICGVSSDKTAIPTLQGNGGIACFCKGSKMRLNDPQYYKCMMDAVICEATDQFMHLHNKCELVKWATDPGEFARQVFKTRAATKLPLRCKTCGVFSDKTTLHHLQLNDGIACFCKGSRLKVIDPQYFQCMMDPVICKATNQFTQMHNYELLGWDQDKFIGQVFKTGNKTTLPLRCKTCGVFSDKTCLNNLQSNQGIACKCTHHKTEIKVMEWLENNAFPMATWENNPIKFGPKSEKGGQCKFDIVGTWPSGIQIIVEVDGAQHFDLEAYHASTDIIANDVAKEQWVLRPPSPSVVTTVIGLVRVLQEDAWGDLNDWEGYLRVSIESLLHLSHQPSPTPRIIRSVVPEYLDGMYANGREQQLEYVQWKTSVENSLCTAVE